MRTTFAKTCYSTVWLCARQASKKIKSLTIQQIRSRKWDRAVQFPVLELFGKIDLACCSFKGHQYGRPKRVKKHREIYIGNVKSFLLFWACKHSHRRFSTYMVAFQTSETQQVNRCFNAYILYLSTSKSCWKSCPQKSSKQRIRKIGLFEFILLKGRISRSSRGSR